jgi:hypothetical protein
MAAFRLVFKLNIDGSHSERLETGRINIFGWFYNTIELAIYATFLVGDGSSKHGGKGSLNYFGTMGRWYVSCQQENKLEAVSGD